MSVLESVSASIVCCHSGSSAQGNDTTAFPTAVRLCDSIKPYHVRVPGPTAVAVMIERSDLTPFGSSAMADIGLDVIVSTPKHHHLAVLWLMT